MSPLPENANIVIIGQGGIVGSTTAYHLVQQGWDNIVGLDKSSIPTDVGSTSHASDFCFMTAHSKIAVFTAMYSQQFYRQRGHYVNVGGMEVARADDNERMDELKRKVASGKAFGSNVSLITPDQVKERFPFVEKDLLQGAMWDPDAGLVVPRSQKVAGELVKDCQETGQLQAFEHTAVTDIDVQNGQVCGVQTDQGYIKTNLVIIATGMWGAPVAQKAGVRLPLTPVEHPLLFFGPYDHLNGVDKPIVYPLFRDQGNSGYVRDTGDPKTTDGGYMEWGYYEPGSPRLVAPDNIQSKEQARLSPSMRDLSFNQVSQAFERAKALVPILGELDWDSQNSFNGLLSITPDSGSLVGEAPSVKGLWMGESVWIKDAPGIAKILSDWITHGRPEIDPHSVDIARFYAIQTTPGYAWDRCRESAQKIYTPPVHPREPYQTGRGLRRSPFYSREVELGGYFMEAGGWERAHGYQANEERLKDYLAKVPERANEWDNRHFWRVSNAEHLALSDHVGMINLSHFAIFDIEGEDAEALMEYLSVAKVGGNTAIGKGVYTHFLDKEGGIHSDITLIRMGNNHYRIVSGGDTGARDWAWIHRTQYNHGYNVQINDKTDELATLGVWGPKARKTLQQFADDPDCLEADHFPFATTKHLWLCGVPVWAFRISYVGEQGFELYCPFSYGLTIWDALYDAGVVPVGIETYANSRRLEKSLRLQNADLEIEYNLYEADLAKPKVKKAEFYGKQAYLEQRRRDHQPAYLCTMTLQDNVDSKDVPCYPVGECPILDKADGDVLIDELGRRSYTTSMAYGPSVEAFIIMGYIPYEYAKEGDILYIEYFNEHYPVKIEAVGYRALYDPEHTRMKS